MKKLVNRINVKGRNLLLACVLGDADINKEGQVRFVHSWKQYKYIKWKFNLLRRNGIKVSNFFRYINTTGYKDYNIHVIEAKRNINSNGKKRGKVEEVIITNFENKKGFE